MQKKDRPAAMKVSMTATIKPLALVLALSATLAGCGSRPPTHWLALPWPGGAAQAAPSTASAQPMGRQGDPAETLGISGRPVLAVRRIDVPEYLQSGSVRYRQSNSLLAEWPDVRWADRLEVALTDHLVARLRERLPGWTVCERHCPLDPGMLTLNVAFAPMDYVRPARQLQAQARWQFSQRDRRSPAAGKADIAQARPDVPTRITRAGAKAYALPVGRDDPSGHAAALAGLLDELAAQLTSELAGAAQDMAGP